MNTLFSYLSNLFKNNKINLLILTIHPLITAFFLIFPSFVIKKLTDSFLIINKDLAIIGAIKWIIIYFIIVAINFLYWRIYQYIITIKFLPELRKNIVIDRINALINNSKLFFNTHSAGEIAHFLIHLNENVIDLVTVFFEKILHSIFSFILIIICFFYYNPSCGIAISSWILFIVIISIYIINKIDKLSTRIILSKLSISKCIVDLFNNISLVQVFCKQNDEINLLHKKTNLLQSNEELNSWYYFKICCMYYISFALMEAISLYILLNQYKTGIITAGDIVFWWTLSGISVMIADNLINDILQLPNYCSGIKEGLDALKNDSSEIIFNKKLEFKEGKIEFKNVYFSFGDKIILENFSLVITPKEKIAIVGFSGSGKTTLIFLLLRMYKPDQGTILIDGQDIAYVEQESLYSVFSVILQENNILDRSILENILYSQDNNHNYNEKKIYEILSLADLNEFKEDIGQSFNSQNHIDSKVLSGGQKQRISIARALYKSGNIFLLDEPTSSLDEITENTIINSINKITADKTLIIITHKLNIVKNMPRILVFEKGKIIEEGSHTFLINQNGLYKKLCELSSII
jgi:ATP-binding cassette subfamily B protein